MVDVNFAKSCAQFIRAEHGMNATPFVQRRIEEVESAGAAHHTLMMWQTIATMVQGLEGQRLTAARRCATFRSRDESQSSARGNVSPISNSASVGHQPRPE